MNRNLMSAYFFPCHLKYILSMKPYFLRHNTTALERQDEPLTQFRTFVMSAEYRNTVA